MKRLIGFEGSDQYKSPPEGAVKGGYDTEHNSYYYVCVADYSGTQPGKFFKDENGKRVCHFGYGGAEHRATKYKVSQSI